MANRMTVPEPDLRLPYEGGGERGISKSKEHKKALRTCTSRPGAALLCQEWAVKATSHGPRDACLHKQVAEAKEPLVITASRWSQLYTSGGAGP